MMAQNWQYGIMLVATIIFIETGLVIMPFLPGDSSLFAAGAFLGINHISPFLAITVIICFAVLGDITNYLVGSSAIGQQIIKRRWVKAHHVNQTFTYFNRFGPMTLQ